MLLRTMPGSQAVTLTTIPTAPSAFVTSPSVPVALPSQMRDDEPLSAGLSTSVTRPSFMLSPAMLSASALSPRLGTTPLSLGSSAQGGQSYLVPTPIRLATESNLSAIDERSRMVSVTSVRSDAPSASMAPTETPSDALGGDPEATFVEGERVRVCNACAEAVKEAEEMDLTGARKTKVIACLQHMRCGLCCLLMLIKYDLSMSTQAHAHEAHRPAHANRRKRLESQDDMSLHKPSQDTQERTTELQKTLLWKKYVS